MQTDKDKPIILGITGTIASGKSSVGRILALRGIAVIDTDRVVHDLLTYDETTKKAIVQEFGESVLSSDPVPGDMPDLPGSKHSRLSPIDRKILGSIVFHSESKRRKLEAIIHPNVILSCRRRVAELGNQQLIAILVPLLFEANLEGEYDVIWSVYTKPEVLRERLATRDKMSAEEIERRLAAQLSQDEKAKRANQVIDNSGNYAQTERQVNVLLDKLLANAGV